MSEWPKFTSRTVVQAAPIFDIVDVGGTLSILVKPYDDHTVERFVTTAPGMMACAEIGGYAVIYDDGFKSVSPKAAFEAGYTRQGGDNG